MIRVDADPGARELTFFKEAESVPVYAMMKMVGSSVAPPLPAAAAGAVVEMPRVANAKSTRK